MNNILFIILVIFLFVGSLIFIFIRDKFRDQSEINRLREVVLAVRSKDVKEYTSILPYVGDEELPEQEDDDLVPLDEVSPEDLLKVQ